jgi:hypothetical protein
MGLPKPRATTSGDVAPVSGIAPMATGGSNYVAGTQTSQHNNYYCGPATAQSIILSWYFEGRINNTHSKMQSSLALSQEALATSAYLNTDNEGQTAWGSTAMTQGLNRWLYGALSGEFYHSYTPSSASALTSKVETDIDVGAMVAANTYEPGGNASRHYNGHPAAKTIRHWISIDGYYNNGNSLRFEDPAYHGQGMTWSATAAYFNLSSSVAWQYMTQYGAVYGIVW